MNSIKFIGRLTTRIIAACIGILCLPIIALGCCALWLAASALSFAAPTVIAVKPGADDGDAEQREKTEYFVISTELGESCDGHSKLIGRFATREEAKAYVEEDIRDMLALTGEEFHKVDFAKMEVFADKEETRGCIWSIQSSADIPGNQV